MADDTLTANRDLAPPPRVERPHGTSPSVNVAPSTRSTGLSLLPRRRLSARPASQGSENGRPKAATVPSTRSTRKHSALVVERTGCDVIGGRAPHCPRTPARRSQPQRAGSRRGLFPGQVGPCELLLLSSSTPTSAATSVPHDVGVWFSLKWGSGIPQMGFWDSSRPPPYGVLVSVPDPHDIGFWDFRLAVRRQRRRRSSILVPPIRIGRTSPRQLVGQCLTSPRSAGGFSLEWGSGMTHPGPHVVGAWFSVPDPHDMGFWAFRGLDLLGGRMT